VAGETEAPVTPEEISAVASATATEVWKRILGNVPASTIMVRLNPGELGIGPFIRDKVWDKQTTDARDNSPVTTLDLLRFGRADAGRAAETLGEGGGINTQLDSIQTTQGEEDAQTDRIEAILNDPAALAAELALLLPPAEPVTQEALEAALRTVFGSLDESATP
jgi:hypothetical protein